MTRDSDTTVGMDDLQPLLDKFERRKQARAEERLRLSKRLAELNAEAERDDITVANLKVIFSKEVLAAAGEIIAKELAPPDAIEPGPSPPPTARDLRRPDKAGPYLVKDMVLAVIREAYPNGLTAKQIRGKAYLRFRQNINPNTLTVSLGRYSKGPEPRARCEGRTWYYIPAKPNGGIAEKESPAATGLL